MNCHGFRFVSQVPGLGVELDTTRLDLQYKSAYQNTDLPDAYERLLLDVVNGAFAVPCRTVIMIVSAAASNPFLSIVASDSLRKHSAI